MKLYELVNQELLSKHLNEGFVSVKTHPELPLRIYNYTHQAQYAHPMMWGDDTIDYCRGLIVDNQDEIISRPFKKFHNFQTAGIPETFPENFPNVEPIITKKYDGSLGIYYKFENFEGIATRGSFTSEQAIWATKWYQEHFSSKPAIWIPNYTPLFEIVYPENRIVVDYDFSGLVLLALVNNRTGAELPQRKLEVGGRYNGVRTVEFIQGKSIEELLALDNKNEEGFVVSYPTEPHKLFEGEPVKVKIKMADYCRLHRIVTGLNPRAIWESVSDPNANAIDVSELPLPVQDWVGKWIAKLQAEFDQIEQDARIVYTNRPIQTVTDQKFYRKECAMYMLSLKDKQHLKGLFFMQLDDKDITRAIWDMIEPKADDRSFISGDN